MKDSLIFNLKSFLPHLYINNGKYINLIIWNEF